MEKLMLIMAMSQLQEYNHQGDLYGTLTGLVDVTDMLSPTEATERVGKEAQAFMDEVDSFGEFSSPDEVPTDTMTRWTARYQAVLEDFRDNVLPLVKLVFEG